MSTEPNLTARPQDSDASGPWVEVQTTGPAARYQARRVLHALRANPRGWARIRAAVEGHGHTEEAVLMLQAVLVDLTVDLTTEQADILADELREAADMAERGEDGPTPLATHRDDTHLSGWERDRRARAAERGAS